jgi:hypothetical protein
MVASIYLRFYIEVGVGVGTFLPTLTPQPWSDYPLLQHHIPGEQNLCQVVSLIRCVFFICRRYYGGRLVLPAVQFTVKMELFMKLL